MMNRALHIGRMAGWALAGALALGCDSALQVEDPQTFSDDDLNSPTILKNVGDGVEGQFHQVLDDVIVFTGLLSDEMEDTSTWIDWADVSLGRVRGDWPSVPGFATTQNELLRNRFAAQNAAERIKKVLGDADAAKSVTLAQVQTTEAWDDLILGMAYCEAPLIANGPRATDAELIKQAVGVDKGAGSDQYDFHCLRLTTLGFPGLRTAQFECRKCSLIG